LKKASAEAFFVAGCPRVVHLRGLLEDLNREARLGVLEQVHASALAVSAASAATPTLTVNGTSPAAASTAMSLRRSSA
jgi:hypothetical protein